MKKTSKLVLRMILWGALIVLLLFAAKVVFLSLRYSKEFMVREYLHRHGRYRRLLNPARA